MKTIFLMFLLVVSINSYADIKCDKDFFGNMKCSNTSVEHGKSITVKNPDFLGNTKIVDSKNKTIANCKIDFLGNMKCR